MMISGECLSLSLSKQKKIQIAHLFFDSTNKKTTISKYHICFSIPPIKIRSNLHKDPHRYPNSNFTYKVSNARENTSQIKCQKGYCCPHHIRAKQINYNHLYLISTISADDFKRNFIFVLTSETSIMCPCWSNA